MTLCYIDISDQLKNAVTKKCIFSYNYYWIVFKFHTSIMYDISSLACAFFLTIGLFFNFWRIFEILK